MARFLTASSIIKQLPIKGKYMLCNNELFLDEDNSIYLTWRKYITDNFTWLKTNNWDTRCSHLHDVGCQYHQIIKVNLTEQQLKDMNLLVYVEKTGRWYCKDIPIEYLSIVKVSKLEINNLFYRMMKSADCPSTPKYIQILYRIGVAFNFKWFFTDKESIDLNNLYK